MTCVSIIVSGMNSSESHVGMKQDGGSNGCNSNFNSARSGLYTLLTTYLSFLIAAVDSKNVYITRNDGQSTKSAVNINWQLGKT